jgi:hypothetical protein
MKKRVVFLGWLMLMGSLVPPASAQVRLGGLVDLEIRRAGSDSSPVINQTPAEDWTLYTPNIRLFMKGDISDQWFVSAALQADYYYGPHLSTPFFSVLNVNWIPDPQKSMMLTAGRFVTPFAGYSDLLLSSQNKFVHLPLAMAQNVSVDKYRGYFTGHPSYSGTAGMSMLYQRMYSQGIKWEGGSLKDQGIAYQLAATLASVSSYTEYGQHTRPNLIGTLTAQPVIWNKFGISVNFGPFMERSAANEVIPDDRFSRYNQLAIGAFTEFSYHYFVLRLAGIWNRWYAPWTSPSGTYLYDDINVSLGHWMSQLTYRFPFWVGGYAGLRVEQLVEGQLSSENGLLIPPPTINGYLDLPEDWLHDTTRMEAVIGYKLDRTITLKASYMYSHNEHGDWADNVFSLQLSAGF